MTQKIKIPYIVKRDNLPISGELYNKEDIVYLNPNYEPHRKLIKYDDIVEQYDLSKCDLVCNQNNLILDGATYITGQIIDKSHEYIRNIENLLAIGCIIVSIKKEDIKKESSKTKYSELAKQIGVSTGDLFIELRKNPEIDKIFGEKNPHHMSIIPEEIKELIELGE